MRGRGRVRNVLPSCSRPPACSPAGRSTRQPACWSPAPARHGTPRPAPPQHGPACPAGLGKRQPQRRPPALAHPASAHPHPEWECRTFPAFQPCLLALPPSAEQSSIELGGFCLLLWEERSRRCGEKNECQRKSEFVNAGCLSCHCCLWGI